MFRRIALWLLVFGVLLFFPLPTEARPHPPHKTPIPVSTPIAPLPPVVVATTIPVSTLEATATATLESTKPPTVTTATSTPTMVPTFTLTPTPTDPCAESLQSRIDRTPSGGTLTLPACTFREAITFHQPIKLYGQSVAEVRGSDIWRDWTRRDLASEGHPIWYSALTLPSMTQRQIDSQYNTPTCSDGTHTTCNKPEQVWFDGHWLRQVDRTPNGGEYVVGSDRRVYLADDPSGHTLEVATRDTWATIPAQVSGVYIHGVTFRHSFGSYQSSAFHVDGSGNTLEHDSFFEAAYAALAIGGADNQILGNEISWNGGMGLSAERAPRLLWQGGTTRYNNRRTLDGKSVSDYWYGWEASGSKVVLADQIHVTGVRFQDNGGPGLWCDIECQATTFDENLTERNLSNGIEFEGGRGPVLLDHNTSRDNRGCGIMVALNQHAGDGVGAVTNNLTTGNAGGGICKGYNNTEIQPGVTYENNGS